MTEEPARPRLENSNHPWQSCAVGLEAGPEALKWNPPCNQVDQNQNH